MSKCLICDAGIKPKLAVDLSVPYSDQIIRLRQGPRETKDQFELRVKRMSKNLDSIKKQIERIAKEKNIHPRNVVLRAR